MKLKKYNLIDEINNIDNKIIEDVLNIKTEQDLKEIKIKEKYMKTNKILRYASLCFGCICIVLIGVLTFNKKTNTQIPNPLLEVQNISEMKKYLGFDVIKLDKEVENYIVIKNDKEYYHARIEYKDKTRFDMEKVTSSENPSGIYGAKLTKEETINDVKVKYYEFENTNYITWHTKDYSYSYTSENKIDEQTVNNLINLTK